jgi:peptidyl-prolyl cis-trans isomerase A (cyclophilin A)
MGEFVIELDPQHAPLSVENFEQYARDGFYDGTIFHRVIAGFIIQGGGYAPDLQLKSTRPPIALESQSGLRNVRGTVAMARTTDPDSATSQFFVNLADNRALDATLEEPGYAVFGVVVAGMEVVDAIALVETHSVGSLADVPVDAVLIDSVTIEAGETTLSPDWQLYSESVQLNFQSYLQNTAINVFELWFQQLFQ